MLLAATDLAGWAKQYGDSASKDTAERLREAALAASAHPAQGEQATAAARYEFVRQLSPRAFDDLWHASLRGDGTFDQLVDAAIEAGRKVSTLA
jgi:hypothetical protein